MGFTCIFAGCDRPAKYISIMKRPCGCYHRSHSSPSMTCIVHAAYMMNVRIGDRETECQQCGDWNKIEVGTVQTMFPIYPGRE